MSQVTESDLAKPDLGKKILQEVLRPISFCYGLGASARLLSYSNGLAFSTAAAVGDQHAGIFRDIFTDIRDSVDAEQHARRVVKIEIKHGLPLWKSTQQLNAIMT